MPGSSFGKSNSGDAFAQSRRRSGRRPADLLSRVGRPLRPGGPACMSLPGPRQRLILLLAVDVSDIPVLLIAILDEDRTVELLIVEFVIIFRLG